MSFKVVSLFSGCGGKDIGFLGGFEFLGKFFKKNPFEIVRANDIDREACKTYSHNISEHITCRDIKEININEIPDCDIVIGGFPCQDFSVAGKRKGLSSERGQLFRYMLDVVKNKKPMVFIAENVKGLTNIDNGDVLKHIKSEFAKAGYKVSDHLLKATDYGVPQTRERVFIVGVREDLEIEFEPPQVIEKTITSKDAIDDLWGKEESNNIHNHNQFSKAKKNKGQGNKQINADKPSPTIRAEHHGNIEFHYRGERRLTVRECARIQSFPDNFIFTGSGSSNYRQIGNAVPPVLARHVGKSIAEMLSSIKEYK